MPYKTTAEKEREKWMTLPEAVTHIRSADGCDEEEARRQLIAALAEGLRPLGVLKWERERNDRSPPMGYTPATTPTDTPPTGPAWLKAKIRWKDGRVRDDWGEYKPGKWRVLLIQRHSVHRVWHSREANTESRGGPLENPVSLVRKAGGRPSVRDQVYDTLEKMRSAGDDLTLPNKKLAEVVAKRKYKKLGDPNWNKRTIEGHISTWKREHAWCLIA
jgi:hypothetical protein